MASYTPPTHHPSIRLPNWLLSRRSISPSVAPITRTRAQGAHDGWPHPTHCLSNPSAFSGPSINPSVKSIGLSPLGQVLMSARGSGAHDGQQHLIHRPSIGFVRTIHKPKCETDCSVSLRSHSFSTSAEFLISLRHRSRRRGRRRRRRRRRRSRNYRAALKKEDRRQQNITIYIYLSRSTTRCGD